MQSQLKKQPILALFGEFYGTKLINQLNTCCSSPAILISLTATCGGINPSGNQTYNVTATATYNTTINGYTSLVGYLSNAPFPDFTNVTNSTLANLNISTAAIFVGNIQAGKPVVMANLTDVNLNAGTIYGMVTDNRGNYSNQLAINLPICPKG